MKASPYPQFLSPVLPTAHGGALSPFPLESGRIYPKFLQPFAILSHEKGPQTSLIQLIVDLPISPTNHFEQDESHKAILLNDENIGFVSVSGVNFDFAPSRVSEIAQKPYTAGFVGNPFSASKIRLLDEANEDGRSTFCRNFFPKIFRTLRSDSSLSSVITRSHRSNRKALQGEWAETGTDIDN